MVPSTFVAIVIALGLTNVTSEERNRFIISHALPWPIRYTFRLKTRGMDAIEGGGGYNSHVAIMMRKKGMKKGKETDIYPMCGPFHSNFLGLVVLLCDSQ